MIYFGIKNYEEFKELFGVVEHGNGNKSRKNKILLSLFKHKPLLHAMANRQEECKLRQLHSYIDYHGHTVHYNRYVTTLRFPLDEDFYGIKSMLVLRNTIRRLLSCYDSDEGITNPVCIKGWDFYSKSYYTDANRGLCEDGDINSIRYVSVKDARTYKMRAGKFMRKLIEEREDLNNLISEQVKIWICEDFAEEWKAYASQFSTEYELHVDDDFCKIYDSGYCVGDFGSCMEDQDYYSFYENCVDAKAAYLTKPDSDEIMARCIIYTKVHVCNSDKVLRLAERQYATDGSDMLKRQLVDALIKAGEIDGYKSVGACCSDSKNFVDCDGISFPSTDFWIRCSIDGDDNVSYQDSFKYYDEGMERAYNDDYHSYDADLATTDGYIETHSGQYYSEYHGEWLDEDSCTFVVSRNGYFRDDEVLYAWVDGRQDYFYEDDVLAIGDDYYYAGRNCDDYESYGIVRCGQCDEYCLSSDAIHSDLTDEYYCCSDCKDDAENSWKENNGWTFSDYDDEYFENEEDVIVAMEWIQLYSYPLGYHYTWVETSISVDTFNDLVSENGATFYNGVNYIDDVLADGEPAHLVAADLRAA